MISKELLSEVLGINILTEVSDDDLTENNILIYWEFDGSGNDCRNINIYELAHKCKEYLYGGVWTYTIVKEDDAVEVRLYNSITRKSFNFIEWEEPAAIFKACEWMLEQKAKTC